MTDAPNTSSYLLFSADRINLPNSQTLLANNGISLITNGTTANLSTIGNLSNLFNFNTPGYVVYDANAGSFTGAQLLASDDTIAIQTGNGFSSFAVVPETSNQLIGAALNGAPLPGLFPTINFIPDSTNNLSLEISPNGATDRWDFQISVGPALAATLDSIFPVGFAGTVLTSNGTTAFWNSVPGTGTVTSVGAQSLSSALTVSSSTSNPFTSSGVFSFSLSNQLNNLSMLSGVGLITQTGPSAYMNLSGAPNTVLIGQGNMVAPIFSTTASLTSLQLTGMPSASTDAATVAYVQAIAAGLTFKSSCVAAQHNLSGTANLNATYNNGSAGVGATLTSNVFGALMVDGIPIPSNGRVLVIDQTAAAQNGIYQLSTVGNVSVAWVLTRTTDYNLASQIVPGSIVPIALGGTNWGGSSWIEQNTVNTIGTDPIAFIPFTYSPASFLQKINNLSDLSSVSTARINLGLSNAATSTFAQNNVLIGGATNSINSQALTNGQLLIGSTGVAPVAAVPTNGTNISWTTGAGTLRADLTATVPVSLGGTGATTLTTNGVLLGNGSGAITATAVGTVGQVLTGTGSAPVWSTPAVPVTSVTASTPIVSSGGTTPNLSLNTVPVGFGGTGNTTLGANSILIGNGTSAVTSQALTNGQLLIGSTGAAPVAAIPTNGTNITWTIGAGTLRADLTATVPVNLGGTGATTLSANGVLIGNGTGAISATAVGTAGQVLTGTGGAPVWSTLAIPVTAVTASSPLASSGGTTPNLSLNTVPVSFGGTGATTLAANGILLGNGTSAVTSQALTNGQLLIGSTGFAPVAAVPTNGTNISWTTGAGTLRADLTATVPVSLGGTGGTTLSSGGVLIGNGTSAITATTLTNGQLLIGSTGAAPVAVVPTNGTNITWTTGAGSLRADLTATVSVTLGGTGATTLGTNGVLLGNGTGAITATAAATTGQVLTGVTGSAPVWSTPVASVTSVTASAPLVSSGGTTPNLTLNTVPVSSGGTGATTLGAGNLLIGNGTSAIGSVTSVAVGQVLVSNGVGVAPVYSTGDVGNVTTVTGNYTALNTDNILSVTSSGALAITLPASPAPNQRITVKDQTGNANLFAITIGSGVSIDGYSGGIQINQAFGSISLYYNNSANWSLK